MIYILEFNVKEYENAGLAPKTLKDADYRQKHSTKPIAQEASK